MEIPFVMRMLNEAQAEFSNLVANVLTFDYLGALAVSLLFPLVLAPRLGLNEDRFSVRSDERGRRAHDDTVFRDEPLFRARGRWIRGGAAFVFLTAGLVASESLTGWVRKRHLRRRGDSTPRARLTSASWSRAGRDDLRLWLNGNLQFSSRDEHRYHEGPGPPGAKHSLGEKRT